MIEIKVIYVIRIHHTLSKPSTTKYFKIIDSIVIIGNYTLPSYSSNHSIVRRIYLILNNILVCFFQIPDFICLTVTIQEITFR